MLVSCALIVIQTSSAVTRFISTGELTIANVEEIENHPLDQPSFLFCISDQAL